ncbi:MAG: tRNA uridine-5-carboxymethylaminomethyl(34) synthesis GTPase MnmE [Candidatus Eisenbacteria bacterium]|nr:tRNA uridine-5-carboxymethylaminomethyl(34) synthesis GTPase MnmE [Candidatus Eisenbacteria bacterium]
MSSYRRSRAARAARGRGGGASAADGARSAHRGTSLRESPNDTIAAISTVAGAGAIAIVRISGDQALGIADAMFEGVSLVDVPTHTVHYGSVVDDRGRPVDEVLATVMRAPGTYTTEDMVEFGCHGGPMPAREVLAAALRAGARQARRGEFTLRAFLGGRIDLVQAEAVADIVASRTRRGLELALGQLEGGLSGELDALRTELLAFRADVESLVDFVDDDIEPATRQAMAATGARAGERIERLLDRCDLGAAVREGVSVAIVGRPNVGKSSLMNALLEKDRAIVTAQPGTTRDAVEDFLHLTGMAVRLVDTAGWRVGRDEAERAGVERAKAAAAGADLALLVVDGSEGYTDEDRAIAGALSGERTLVAVNKSDLGCVLREEQLGQLPGASQGHAPLRVSALTGDGLGDLREALARTAAGCDPSESAMVTNVRHIDALRRCRESLARATTRVAEGGEAELAAVDLAEATEALGSVTGETTPEDVLERIFRRFCVGK